jgi:hypothetical protein
MARTSITSAKRQVKVRAKEALALKAGQIWKAGESYILIQEAGTRLIHYKMSTKLHRPGLRRHLASIQTVRDFLKSQRAALIPPDKAV